MQNSQNNEESSLKLDKMISRGVPRGLLLLAIGLFIVCSILSAVYLDVNMYRPLGTHYSAIVSIMEDIHETLIIKTLKIHAVFFILTVAGIFILGVIYTHRICGPLVRVNLCSRSVAGGKFDTKIRFRKNDAIHLLADVFNRMTKNHSDKIATLKREAESLEESVRRYELLVREGKSGEAEMRNVLEADRRMKDILNTIRV